METFENYLKSQYHPETVKNYCYHQQVFTIHYPDYKNFRYQDFIQYINSKRLKNQSENYLLPIVYAIKKYFDYLIYVDQITYHPIRNFNLRFQQNSKQIQNLLTKQELLLLLDRKARYEHLIYRDKLIISLLIFQGLLSHEIVQLKVTDFDIDEQKVFIRGGMTTNARKLNFSEEQLEWFEIYVQKYRSVILEKNRLQKSDYLFLSSFANPLLPDNIHNLITTMKHLVPDKKLNTQTIRQSVIANLLNNEHYALEDVQYFVGHKWPTSTQLYKRKITTKKLNNINLIHPIK